MNFSKFVAIRVSAFRNAFNSIFTDNENDYDGEQRNNHYHIPPPPLTHNPLHTHYTFSFIQLPHMNYTCTPFPPQTGTCSSRGSCIAPETCECSDPNWLARGDFSFSASSCDIYAPAVQGLWATEAAVNALSFLYALYYLFIKARASRKTKASVAFGLTVMSSNFSLFVTGALRASDVRNRFIGGDVVITCSFAFGVVAYFAAVAVFCFTFIDLLARQAKCNAELSREMFVKAKLLLPVGCGFGVLGGVMTLGMLQSNSYVRNQVLASFHYLLCATSLAVMGLYTVPKLTMPIIRDIKHSISENPAAAMSSTLTVVMEKLILFTGEIKNQSIQQIVVAILFSFFPFLTMVGSSYFIPMAWGAGASISMLAIHVCLPVPKPYTSSSTDKGKLVNSTYSSSASKQKSQIPIVATVSPSSMQEKESYTA